MSSGKFSILILDDIEANVHSLKLILEDNFSLDIYSALNAQDAISILMENSVNLILCDVQMPEIDGFQFAEYIKGINEIKDIPIIFITGIYDTDKYKAKGFDVGAIDYITKPIDDDILSSKLKVYIDLFEKQKQNENELLEKNEVLIHQAKMATLGEMIGVISHQLKQPLNILSLYCDDVKNNHKFGEITDDFIEDFSKNTKDQIQFLTTTIDGFRNFFDPNKEKRVFYIKDALNETIKLLDKQIENNNIHLDVDISDEKVYGVKTELQQVFLNLITNAKDVFIDRNIENRLIKVKSAQAQKHSLIVLEDNAGGIKKENLEKIFDPYFTTKEYGTGTGLYMVKLVVKSSFKGDLKVENSSTGAKFVIALPKEKST